MFKFWLLFWFIVSTKIEAHSFCEEAWKKSSYIYAKILIHPFNKELEAGTLPSTKFDFYQAQDKIYLKVFTQVLTDLRIKVKDLETKKLIAKLPSVSSNEMPSDNSKADSVFLTPATFNYSNFLRAQSAFKSAAELGASVLPCYWIYLELADSMKKNLKPTNPYKKWIETYSSDGYRTSVQQMKIIVDNLASASTDETQKAMFEAYVDATKLELAFWDDSYNGTVW